MKIRITAIALLLSVFGLGGNAARADSQAVAELLQAYAAQGAPAPDAEAGKQLWLKTFAGDDAFPKRSCTSCHTASLQKTGEHVKTHKIIDPMSPSVNAKRLTDRQEIEKWLLRNCKWTLGRECTAAEKANVLIFISGQ